MTLFGPGWRGRWHLDPSITYLNHGTVGATPIAILEAQRAVQVEIERHPSRFLLHELTEVGGTPEPRIRTAAQAVAEFLGARGEDLVFVDNATSAISSVLQSPLLSEGDTVAVTTLGYGSVRIAADHFAERRGLRVAHIPLPFPVDDPSATVAAFAEGLPDGARLAIVDHIASDTGLLLPIAEIAAICRDRGVLLLVDGAHAPGSIHLDIEAIGADLYVGNLHKWMWTPRSSAILWVRPELQDQVRPAVISWGFGQSFTAEFDLAGTRDPSHHLTAPLAIAELKRIGFDAIVAYNHDLVWRGAQHLAERWGTTLITPESMVGTMVAVPLPDCGIHVDNVHERRWALCREHDIEVHLGANASGAWIRVGAQIYNGMSDFERVAEVFARL
ncbi:MAG: aminotransferase class V-fold PLP-dependent enzyme [Proteobacteria bacterium]|nr:aminotransferase class V-fold PLP-dependent enzyme [Pseudomonadota bacterium]